MIRKFFLVMGVSLPTLLNAQFNRFEAGVEAGPTFTSMWGNNSSTLIKNSNVAINYSAGAFFKYSPVKFFGVQTGVFSERVSAVQEVIFTDENGNELGARNMNIEADYITMPLLGKFSFGNRLKGSVTAGTFFSYMLNSRLALYSPEDPYGITIENYTHSTNRFNTGVVLGVGIEYTIVKGLNIGLDVRDQLGLINIDPYPNSTSYTNSLQLLAKISYGFK